MKKKEDVLLRRLIKWCNTPGNTQAKLAVALGYKTTGTIASWFCRGKLPQNRRVQIEEFLEKEKIKWTTNRRSLPDG